MKELEPPIIVDIPADGSDYIVDPRPMCQGMPFVLTDSAHPRLILKYDRDFMILDSEAYVPACNTLGYGYYRSDTRHLSEWSVTLDGVPLSLLSFDVEKGYAGSFLYTNPQTPTLPQQKIMVQRQVVLSEVVAEKLVIENFHSEAVTFDLCIRYQSDFADMFEVRGFNRAERGRRMRPKNDAQNSKIFLAYRGLDECLIETIVEFRNRRPDTLSDGVATFKLTLPVREPLEIETHIYTRTAGVTSGGDYRKLDFNTLLADSDKAFAQWRFAETTVTTDNRIVNFILDRGYRDLYILRQNTPQGTGIAAGIPWYSTVFGRDSAIVAWQMLPFRPDLARECIDILAAYQGTIVDEFRAERPGKIMHELRLGELARLKLIPHTPYYGTVDATALWLALVARYLEWTGDMEYIQTLWPRILLALSWLEEASPNGYITYKRESSEGLENQGWKDSGDSISLANGVVANPPIALCEAQGYVYAAQIAVADTAQALGNMELAASLRRKASDLKARFFNDFWMPELQFPALALDGEGNQVTAVSSNAGHCLWSGIIEDDSANHVADRLLAREMDSGWGLRTLSANASYYNPISYHNGSVWPHDNAIIIEGLRRIGRIKEGHKIMGDMVAVAQNQQDFRLPELVCGFERTDWSKPINYPVSCSPQAWAAGSIFQTLTACANFQPDARNKILRVVDPCLPAWLGNVTIRRLKVGQAELDIAFETVNGNTFCQILRKSGQLKVIIES
ncbi:MAG: amylo-alpha-1,6-glucosidase [Cyanobacteria bacterium SZAS LIN-3]|nr:amylo-alpha-1,6-glucosidase [Cyanobacteria bacterium SZAS LIN-3]